MSDRIEAAPDSLDELSAAVKGAHAAECKIEISAGSTKREWGNALQPCQRALSLRRLDRVLEHAWADMTVTVEAGCRIAPLQRQLAQHNQRLALDPLWPEQASVGGVIATNDSGVLRLRYGSARDLLLGVTLVLADGTVTKSGGKVVKNVAGYDLPKLVIGAFGTLGIVAHAVFRLHPLPELRRSLQFCCASVAEAQRFVLALQAEPLAHSALQLRAHGASECSVEIMLEGTPRGVEAAVSAVARLAGATRLEDAPEQVWQAREALWLGATREAIVKVSVLPSELARTLTQLAAAGSGEAECVFQATGLGYARLALGPEQLLALRRELEARAGSLVLLRRSPELQASEAFGRVPALGLMRALKHQFDPEHTLNPGRFIAGL
jgi:glycolate oxidase FAD binding subunit